MFSHKSVAWYLIKRLTTRVILHEKEKWIDNRQNLKKSSKQLTHSKSLTVLRCQSAVSSPVARVSGSKGEGCSSPSAPFLT